MQLSQWSIAHLPKKPKVCAPSAPSDEQFHLAHAKGQLLNTPLLTVNITPFVAVFHGPLRSEHSLPHSIPAGFENLRSVMKVRLGS